MSPRSDGRRELHLGLNVLGAGGHAGAWRWPAADPNAFHDIEHYVWAAQTAERGKFDALFLADRPALFVNLEKTPPWTALEPTIILTALSRETERIGLIGTASTTYNEPFNIARRFQALDVVSGGRAAWNAVTTSDATTVANFGGPEWSREERYRRAEEFVETVRALWGTWEPGAVIADQAAGVYADPARIRRLDGDGEFFQVRGPLLHPGSAQGEPVIVQAGGSASGQRLAGLSADAVFSAAIDLATAVDDAERVRQIARDAGRSHTPVIMPGIVTIIGGTEAEAQQRAEDLAALTDESEALVALAARLQVPIEQLSYDRPIDVSIIPPWEEIKAPHGFHRTLLGLIEEGLTVRQILARSQASVHRVIVGSPEQVAESIQEWFEAGAADGFNLMPDVVADGLPAFVDHVVPILQERGIFRREYEGTTLRSHLGLPTPGASGADAGAQAEVATAA